MRLATESRASACGVAQPTDYADSNDPDRPLVTLPVNLQVDPVPPIGNELFRDRFEEGVD